MRASLPLLLLTALAAPPAAGAVWRDDPAPTRPALATLLERARASLGRAPFDSTRTLMRQVERGAQALADSAALVEARVVLAFLDSRQASLPEALARFAEAERAVPAGDGHALAQVRCWRAPILTFAGRPEAVQEIAAGIAGARVAGDPILLGLCYQGAVTVLTALAGPGGRIEAYADSAATTQAQAGDHFGWSGPSGPARHARRRRTPAPGGRPPRTWAARAARRPWPGTGRS